MNYKLLYPGFTTKAVTFSFDDGTFYDVFLVDMMNKYGLKCTFNLNTGIFGATAHIDFGTKIVYHNRLSEEQTGMLYKGHELASHSLHHPLLINQSKEFLDYEVLEDIKNLDRITGEKTVGFVYPGGPHDDFTDAYLKDKVLYARSASANHSFELPDSFVPFDPTVFFLEDDFVKMSEEYLASDPDHITWLYIWGHSYEFELGDTYKNLDHVCKLISERTDVWCSTNRDVIDYVNCARALKSVGDELINDSHREVYVEYGGKKLTVKANSKLKVKK